MSEVKIVLKRSPQDPENGVWIDGKKIENVMEVSVFGTSKDMPEVMIRLLPKKIVLGADQPEVDIVNNG